MLYEGWEYFMEKQEHKRNIQELIIKECKNKISH